MAIVTLAEVLTYLGVASSTKLSIITDGVNEFIVEHCAGTTFETTSFAELHHLDPYQTLICLGSSPLVTVTSVEDPDGNDVDLLAIDYDNGIVEIKSSFWNSFPTIEVDSEEYLTIEGQYGFSEIPSDVKLAAYSIIEDRYYQGDSTLISEKLADRSWKKNPSGIPLQASRILANYVRD
jgi:hypothetical protein